MKQLDVEAGKSYLEMKQFDVETGKSYSVSNPASDWQPVDIKGVMWADLGSLQMS